MTKTQAELNHDIEEIFKQIGEFGPYQLFLFIIIGLVALVPAVIAYGFSFYGAVPNHRLINKLN